jgi:hypothetical protein
VKWLTLDRRVYSNKERGGIGCVEREVVTSKSSQSLEVFEDGQKARQRNGNSSCLLSPRPAGTGSASIPATIIGHSALHMFLHTVLKQATL